MQKVSSKKIEKHFNIPLHIYFPAILLLLSCSSQTPPALDTNIPKQVSIDIMNTTTVSPSAPKEKLVIYQVFTRLFGNKNPRNKPWGTLNENGVGKFNDFTPTALNSIKELGVTHIWFTGVPHHAVINDYRAYGISLDDPDVVKGRAGSPYAVKDYYNVNPDLAVNPANRLTEFERLIERTHQHGMKVMIDIVPNHVARNYQSISKPAGVSDFGENDDSSNVYSRDNNFYYIPEQHFQIPISQSYQPLNGEKHALSDGKFNEYPAKWTGNGSRLAQPSIHDWYETVKINYGVKPDGSYDFPILPDGYQFKNAQQHLEFWQQQDVPDSWLKFKDITQYWLHKGVDGFRYDMAEMVPVEFWSYLNAHIKATNPNAVLLAEVYNPDLYRDYIHKGKMDYLYDKVDLYDTLKLILQGKQSTDAIIDIQAKYADIEHQLLHFLDNHDEQRISSPEFVGNANKGKPAMVVSALMSTSPTMIYFGQEVGEDGSENMGFGTHSRTTIFDYAGVPAHQRWMNNGLFDGGQSTKEEKELRTFYQKLLTLSRTHKAITGNYADLHAYNRQHNLRYQNTHTIFTFARFDLDEQLIVLSNFGETPITKLDIIIPPSLIQKWGLTELNYTLTNELARTDDNATQTQLTITQEGGRFHIDKVEGLASFVFKIKPFKD